MTEPNDESRAPHRFWHAIWYIVLADITMSTDNILAIAGASHGNFWLILFGLAVSIPFIVLSSNLLANLMDRFVYLRIGLSIILVLVGMKMVLSKAFPIPNYISLIVVMAILLVTICVSILMTQNQATDDPQN